MDTVSGLEFIMMVSNLRWGGEDRGKRSGDDRTGSLRAPGCTTAGMLAGGEARQTGCTRERCVDAASWAASACASPFVPQREGGVAAAVVELDALANAVGATAQDQHLQNEDGRRKGDERFLVCM